VNLQSRNAQLEADRSRQKNKTLPDLDGGSEEDAGISLSASKRVVIPGRQVSWLRIVVGELLPKATASVDLVHDSPVTVTGSRRIRTGFPFQLSRATCRRL